MWAWLLRRQPTMRAAAPPRATPFDAVVDLGPGALGRLAPEVAMERAAAGVRQLQGAGRVRVRLGNDPAPIQARVFPAGRGDVREGEPWTGLRTAVERAVEQALAQALVRIEPPSLTDTEAVQPLTRTRTQPRPPMWTQPGTQALIQAAPIQLGTPGFAEAPGQMDALAALASLAQSVQQPAPRSVPAAPSREPDIRMLSRLLGFVLPAEDRATAAVAVRRFGSYAAVLAAPASELRQVAGLGPHSIAAIKLVHEAAVRLARAGVTGQAVLDDPARLTAYLSAALARERVEQFRILFLDERGMLKADEVQATGTVNHTPVYPREVVRRALELGAAALVLVHNHPSGDPTPSGDDIAMTAEIRRAADALGIGLRDHVIVGNGRTLSFRDAGLL